MNSAVESPPIPTIPLTNSGHFITNNAATHAPTPDQTSTTLAPPIPPLTLGVYSFKMDIVSFVHHINVTSISFAEQPM